MLASKICQSQIMSEFYKKQTIYVPLKQENVCIFTRKKFIRLKNKILSQLI